MENTIAVYTDGACSGNPGPGGWGAIILNQGTETVLSGFEADTTNNRMELTAVIQGLTALNEIKMPVTLYTDSQYIVNANNNNVDAWKCPIVVVYDTNNNANRCTHRFDWFGWEDGELAASQNNGSMWCGSMEEYYAVAQDCTVRATYQLVGGNLTETYTITANSGAYAGNSYFWHTSVSGIAVDSVTVALAPEFTQVILTSVRY